MTDPRVEWLREQMETRLARARALSASTVDSAWVAVRNDDFDWMVCSKDDGADGVADAWREDVVLHIAANDPQQVIADCEADLAILDEHAPVYGYGPYPVCRTCGDPAERGYEDTVVRWPCPTARAVASRFKHQPGYAAHWGEPAVRS